MHYVVTNREGRVVGEPTESFTEAKNRADDLQIRRPGNRGWPEYYNVEKREGVYCTQTIDKALKR